MSALRENSAASVPSPSTILLHDSQFTATCVHPILFHPFNEYRISASKLIGLLRGKFMRIPENLICYSTVYLYLYVGAVAAPLSPHRVQYRQFFLPSFFLPQSPFPFFPCAAAPPPTIITRSSLAIVKLSYFFLRPLHANQLLYVGTRS